MTNGAPRKAADFWPTSYPPNEISRAETVADDKSCRCRAFDVMPSWRGCHGEPKGCVFIEKCK